MNRKLMVTLAGVIGLAGCATTPSGPDVMALPGTGRSFDEFRADDHYCRDYALQQIGGRAREQTADSSAVGRAALGTAIGAVAGAAIGGRDGAGFGAGTGLIVGSTAGAESSRRESYGSQRRYDAAYIQCMYALGHRVPVSGAYTSGASRGTASVPPPPGGLPPAPPPGTVSR